MGLSLYLAEPVESFVTGLHSNCCLVAYSALQRGDDLNDPTVYQWYLLRLTYTWDPTTGGGRVLQQAGARTHVFEAQHITQPKLKSGLHADNQATTSN